MGSLGRLIDAFWRPGKDKESGDNENEDQKNLGHYGSILFDFEFHLSQSNPKTHKEESLDSKSNETPPVKISPNKVVKDKARPDNRQTPGFDTERNASDEVDGDGRWMNFSQRPTTTLPVPIPKPTHYHTHNFERIEAIYI